MNDSITSITNLLDKYYFSVQPQGLSASDVRLEAKNLLRRYEKGTLDDSSARLFFQASVEEWERAAKDIPA